MIEIKNKHLALRPQCGICADIIFTHERAIAIYGNHDSSSFSGRTQHFTFPPINRQGIDVGGFRLCRSPRCRRCPAKSSPELVTIHLDCYSIFTKECHVDMDGLWLHSAWRFPWRGAHPLHISDQHLDSEGLKRTAEAFGLSGICRLPRELLDIIHCYSNHSLFWRYIPVLQFASCVKETAPKPLTSFQLGQVLSWKRDEYPKYITPEETLPIIRLTIDSEGICRVERLSYAPVYSGECNDSYRTIVQDASDVAEIEVQFKDGLMRLKVPRKQPALPIWNTSAPPDLTSGKAYGTERLSRNQISKLSDPYCFSWQHLHAVEVDKIRGITFYFRLQTFAGIHIHYEEKPSAMDDKYEQFVNRRQDKSTWIYLPISKNDQLLALDIRQMRRLGMNILSRTRLVGDIIIGPQFQSPFKDLGLSKSTPQTIVYSEALEGSPVTFLDTYSKRPYQDEPPKLFPLEKYGEVPDPHPLGHAPFFSWAPLDDISSTLTFNDWDTGFCQGIMFQYGNGGCRTVGQCRWHVDSVTRVGHPRVLQFKYERKPARSNSLLHVVRVAFRRSDYEQTEKGWECHSLKGFVAFWYTEGSSYLAINANKAHPGLDMSVPERMIRENIKYNNACPI